MSKTIEIRIRRDGTVRAIHDDSVAKLMHRLGDTTVARATHVDPTVDLSPAARILAAAKMNVPASELPDAWWADLSPCGVTEVLGPFNTKIAALDAEVAWLLANKIPLPTTLSGR